LILCLSDTIGRITCAVFLEIQFMAFWGFLRLSMTKYRHTWIDQSVLEIQKWAFWGFLRLSMPKHRHTWIDQSFVLADLSIFYERSL